MREENDSAARRLALDTVTSRRAMLCGLAGAGALGALSACSGCGRAALDLDPERPLAAVSDVPVGGGLVVDDEVVVVQPVEGEFAAFDARCTHENGIVQAPDSEGLMVCPRHYSKFDIEGSVVSGPADSGLKAVEVSVADGEVFPAA
ncbi:QcrA and Rieske domain-containing protein [Salininema proteolyticum]|uniref:Ubiquinol-cytochrome c reductase iron-sulfur subunit n=1 Tax=Salininema proteolyticum TaxID=1607685 RepID=A0ABV8TXY0_9ACTN